MLFNISKSFLIASLAIILAAVLWSLDGVLIRPFFYEIPAINIVFVEHLLGSILLFPFIIFWWNKIKNISQKNLFNLFWISFFGWLLWTLMITEAYFAAFRGDTTFSTVIILQKLQPFFCSISCKYDTERKTFKEILFLGSVVAIASWYMIAYWGLWKEIFSLNFSNNAATYALLAAFAFWSSTVFWKDLVSELWFKLTTALRFIATAMLSFIAIVIFWKFEDFWLITFFHGQLLLLVAFTSGAWALFLYYFGLKRVKASNATIFELAWPLSGVLFDWYFNGNILSPIQIIFSLLLFISFFMIIEEHKAIKK